MKENIKDIPGYEGLYKISSFGYIISLGNGNSNNSINKKLKGQNNGKGYILVNLYKNGIMKSFTVHKLIANIFLVNNNNLKCINHLDGNKENNNVNNLEWCTYKDNSIHAFKNGLHKGSMCGRFGKNNPRSKKVNQYDLNGTLLKMWNSIMDIERELGFHNSGISACCKGKLKTSGGYKWEYFIF